MKPEVANFLTSQKVGAISVVLADGTPHSATVHYSSQANPLKVFVQTSDDTEKVKPFMNGEVGKGAFVIGFNEKEMVTLQMRGSVRAILDKDELEGVYKIHYAKHPSSEKYKGPNTVFLEFSPTWWRYTDFNTDPETILTA